jgi:putative DNA primase/helicase
MVGARNVAAPTLTDLGDPFGRQCLIGKTLAIIGDVRIGRRADKDAIVENLLGITGEDEQEINRKNRTFWSGQLTTRFLLSANKLPDYLDESGALMDRLVLVRTFRTIARNTGISPSRIRSSPKSPTSSITPSTAIGS